MHPTFSAMRCSGLAAGTAQTLRRKLCFQIRPLAAAALLLMHTTATSAHSVDLESYQSIIADAAHRFAIPTHWISAIIVAESSGDSSAVSPKGAMGLMQIMPQTWEELRDQYTLGPDPFEPADNIMAGTAYLRQMLDWYGSVALMLAAYNAGPGRVDEHLATERALPAETVDYGADLLPQLSSAYQTVAQFAPRSVPSDPFAAAIFVPIGDGFREGWRQQTGPIADIGAVAEPHRPTAMSGNAAAVRPASALDAGCLQALLPNAVCSVAIVVQWSKPASCATGSSPTHCAPISPISSVTASPATAAMD